MSGLLEKASAAVPPGRGGNLAAELLPVYLCLLERGFEGPAAVAWLVKEGAVPAKESGRVYEQLRHRVLRRKRKGGCGHE